MDTNKSLISTIDKWFDKYAMENYGEKVTPYDIETNATLLSFFKKAYKVIKDNNYNDSLKQTYINCLEDVIKRVRFIENSRIYKYKLEPNGTYGGLDKAYAINDCLTTLYKKYTNRNYYKFLSEEEQKIGYKDGRYYDETIYISKGLIPSFDDNESGNVKFDLKDNPYMIKMNYDGTFVIYSNSVVKNFKNLQEVKNEIIRMASTGSELLEFFETRKQVEGYELNTSYFVTFAFEDGFTVDANNEYEQDNGLLLELFQCTKKSFEEEENYLEKYLKDYFYKMLLEKYRTKEILDKETNLKTSDITATNYFKAIVKKYENLSGKGGNIGGINTIDFDYNGHENNKKYSKLPFFNSVYHDNQIDFYIEKEFLTGDLRLLKHYDKIDFDSENSNTYLSDIFIKENSYTQACNSNYISYFDSKSSNGNYGIEENGKNINVQSAKFIKYYSKEIKNNILKQNFFAVFPRFKPGFDDTLTENYFKIVPELEKETFFDDSFEPNIDIKFEKKYMILSIKTSINIDSKDVFGAGELTIRKLPQKFCDNTISEVTQTEAASRNSNFEVNEFNSLLDDREFAVISKTDTLIAETEYGYTNVMYDETGSYFIETEIPDYKKTTIVKKNNEWWLDCTEFSKYNNIDAIGQIRIILMNSNKNRFLFNVDRIEEIHKLEKVNIFEIDIDTTSDLNISYVTNEKLYIAANTNSLFTNPKTENVNVDSNKYETVSFYSENKDEDYTIVFSPTEEIKNSYVDGDEIIFMDDYTNVKKNTDNDYNTLVVNGNIISEEEYKITKYLVLKNNTVTNKLQYKNEIECQILDYISSNGTLNKKELGQYVYNSDYDNSYKKYEIEHEKAVIKNSSKSKKLKLLKNTFIYTLTPKKIIPINPAEKKIACLKNKCNEFYRIKQNILSPVKNIKLKLNKLEKYSFSEPKRASIKNHTYIININNTGMKFDGSTIFEKKCRMTYQEKINEVFNDLPLFALNCAFDNCDFDLDLRSDKFIIFIKKHHKNRKHFGYIISDDAKKLNKNFEPSINSNNINELNLFKASIEDINLDKHNGYLEDYNDLEALKGYIEYENKEIEEEEYIKAVRSEQESNSSSFGLGFKINDIDFLLTEKNHEQS